MPIYEYECDLNQHRFEQWQSINDEPIRECPSCGSSVHKIFHPAGIIFKGSGWYITDSRTPAASGSKTDSKTEAKTDSPGDKKTPKPPSGSSSST